MYADISISLLLCLMSNTMLLVTLLIASLTLTGAQTIGVCYGRDGNNLPQPSEVIALCKSRGIGRMRIYDPNQGVLQALKGSNLELILGVPNSDLQSLAADSAAASRWVQTNVLNYYPDVKIKYISVGNEVSPVNGNAQYVSFLVPAMTNVYNAILAAGLYGKVRVSTAFDTGVIGNSYPPSAAEFKQDIMWFLNPIIGFLTGTRAPLLVNIYPYFSVMYSSSIKLSYALFTNPSPEFIDSGNNLPYQNLFDAMLDGVYSALEKASGSSLEIVVSESGWPSSGGTATTLDNACTYNQNLIRHVKTRSPKKPGKAIETYLFAMFNENLKNPEFEKYFGLFYPNQAPVCTINFFDQVSDM